jgi:hypothetical protein
MIKSVLRTLFATLILGLTACNKEKPVEPAPEIAPSASPPPALAAPAAPAAVDVQKLDAPTEAEFEAEAEQSISAKNMDSEIDKLEREISSEK